MSREWALSQPLIEVLIAGLRVKRLEIQRLIRKNKVSLFWEDDSGSYPMILAWIPLTVFDLAIRFPYRNGVLLVKIGQDIHKIPILDSDYTI